VRLWQGIVLAPAASAVLMNASSVIVALNAQLLRRNRDIVKRLFVSEATVKSQPLHMSRKLGVNDGAGAVGAAFERGLLTRSSRPS
jgi:DNA-binding NarL/FixJ family response regulator